MPVKLGKKKYEKFSDASAELIKLHIAEQNPNNIFLPR
jgi:hypothetical protein